MLYKKFITSLKKIFIHPIFIGLLIITLIPSYFLYRTISAKQRDQKLVKKLKAIHQNTNKIKVPLVSPREVFRWINHHNVQLVDIRSREEYRKKHIESSINLPLEEISKNVQQLRPDKSVIIIDRNNSQKGKILVKHFAEQGLNIKYLDGGILKYAQENYPLISETKIANMSDLMKVSFLSAKEVKNRLLRGKIFSFVDTRNSETFKDNHILGSLNVPLEEIENIKKKLPSHTILLYDSNPWRSFQAGIKLYDMGIFDVYVCNDKYEDLKRELFDQDSDAKEKKEKQEEKMEK